MKTSVIILFLLLLPGLLIRAQEQGSAPVTEKHHSFGLQFGLNQMKEMCLLPLVHKGILTSFSYESEKKGDIYRQLQFSLIYSRVKTSMEDISKSGNIRLGFYYSKYYMIFHNNRISCYAGPKIDLSYSFMQYPQWDESHSYWADYLSLGPGTLLSVKQKKDSEWLSSLSFPLFGLFSRPDKQRAFKFDDYSFKGLLCELNSNIEPGSFNKVFHLDINTEYRFPVSATKRQAITCALDFIRISGKNEPPLLQIISRIGIKIIL